MRQVGTREIDDVRRIQAFVLVGAVPVNLLLQIAELLAALRVSVEMDIEMIKRFVWLYLAKSVRVADASKFAEWVLSRS